MLLGDRIKQLRESKAIALESMAERSGLDIEQLTRIEQNIDLPSLAPLIKVARVLGVRLGTLLDDQSNLGPVITRAGHYTESFSFSTDDARSRQHMDYYSLSAAKTGRHMEPFMIQVQPASGMEFTLSSHEGEEFIYCMEGALEITYGQSKYVLEAGDSIYYDSIVSHHVHAADEQGARILAVVYTPF